jgi:hypothetical protein
MPPQCALRMRFLNWKPKFDEAHLSADAGGKSARAQRDANAAELQPVAALAGNA